MCCINHKILKINLFILQFIFFNRRSFFATCIQLVNKYGIEIVHIAQSAYLRFKIIRKQVGLVICEEEVRLKSATNFNEVLLKSKKFDCNAFILKTPMSHNEITVKCILLLHLYIRYTPPPFRNRI